MMSHNKILGAAIAAALSVGGGTAQAADPTFKNTSPVVDKTPIVAMELFETDKAKVLPTGKFGVEYKLELTADIDKLFYLTFTLSGAQWEGSLSASNLSVAGWTGATTYMGGEASDTGDTTAKYVVRADNTAIDKDATLTFDDFQVKVLTGLSTSGTAVTLTVKLEDANGGAVSAEKEVTLVESGVGAKVELSSGDDNNVKIDVATGGTFFTDGKYQTANNTAASLGTIAISYPGNRAKNYTLTADWDFDGANGVKDGTLTINNGPFAASVTHKPTANPAVNLVFIDLDNPGTCAVGGTNIPADTEVNTTTATWKLTEANLEAIFSGTTKASRNICVAVPDKNTTAINVPDKKPTASLTINYEIHKGLKFDTDLRYIKRNGVVCTLYNVPDDDRADKPSIRITNRSSNEKGSVLIGTLRATIDGEVKTVFKNVTLFGGTKIKPNQTFRLSGKDLADIAEQNPGFGSRTWGRGILTISSDLLNMEVFGLVRQKGGTLMNLSKAASGQACGSQ